MRILLLLGLLIGYGRSLKAQLSVRYDSSIQSSTDLQYYKPAGNNLFAGDCIPFYKDGTYYLYWLIDSAHHSALHGLGGHQWVLSTTRDLTHWVQHPVVLGIDEDWEKSICTGSVVYSNHTFYAFYATRLIENGKVNEQLSYATSSDGIHFQKQKPNPFYTSAPGYSKRNFRDPKVLVDRQGVFHLFIASQQDSVALAGLDGCLVHLVSTDLKKWEVRPPVITGQSSVPECPDYFYWRDWYYLVYSDNGNTSYLKSRSPYGPWEQPSSQVLDEDWSNVVKTAEFAGDRRIAASWIPSRSDNKDDNGETFGGNLLLRELTQLSDGTLATSFPPEMIPATGKPLALSLIHDKSATVVEKSGTSFGLSSPEGIGSAHFEQIPVNARITLELEPQGNNEAFGLYLRASGKGTDGYQLSLQADKKRVTLGNTHIEAVTGLEKPIKIDIVMKDDIIDVSIDHRRCIVNRTIERKGTDCWFFVKHGSVKFRSVTIAPLLK